MKNADGKGKLPLNFQLSMTLEAILILPIGWQSNLRFIRAISRLRIEA